MNAQECRNCKFSASAGGDTVCRRFPPNVTTVLKPKQTIQGMQLQPIPITSWPLVRPDSDWCGEFAAERVLAS